MFRKNTLTNIGFIAALVMIILMVLVGNSKAEIPECSGILKDEVKMFFNPHWGTHMPLWYELEHISEWTVQISGHATWVDEYYLVDNGLYRFWTTAEFFERRAPCNDYEVTELGPILGVGCGNPYDPQQVQRSQTYQQDGRQLGDRGSTLGGWGYATFNGEAWVKTPYLPNNLGGGLIEVYMTSFSEECLAALPIPEQE
jgi:hypothetical protein